MVLLDNKTDYNLIVVLGATAGSKTSFATNLAYKLDTEIISADSRQVYRGMDLGTGKDIADYTVNGKQIPYHLIDIVDAGYKYNVFEYQNDFLNSYDDILKRGKLPVLCGGTGMYLDAVIKGYRLIDVSDNTELRASLADKSIEELKTILESYGDLHNTSDVDNIKRAIRAIEIAEYYKNNPQIELDYPEIKPLIMGIKFDRNTRRKRITERLKARFEEGMIDEAKQLLDSGVPAETLMYYGLEYKFLTQHILGELTYDEMFKKLEIAIHQFSKRQMTWFRGMENKGVKIHWLDGFLPMEKKIDQTLSLLFFK